MNSHAFIKDPDDLVGQNVFVKHQLKGIHGTLERFKKNAYIVQTEFGSIPFDKSSIRSIITPVSDYSDTYTINVIDKCINDF